MKIRPLVINEQVIADVARVTEFAETHRYNIHDVYDFMGGRLRPPGDNPGHVCILPIGYRCVFSIEQQSVGWVRHLSMSVPGFGNLPSPAAMVEISKLFGFRCPWEPKNTAIHVEQLDPRYYPGADRAVNVMQMLEEGAVIP